MTYIYIYEKNRPLSKVIENTVEVFDKNKRSEFPETITSMTSNFSTTKEIYKKKYDNFTSP